MAMNVGIANQNNSKENFDSAVKAISDNKILKKLLTERFLKEEDAIDSDITFYSSDDSPGHHDLDHAGRNFKFYIFD